MMRLREIAKLGSGSPQFRIKESSRADDPTYYFYGQAELEGDLTGDRTPVRNKAQICTNDKVEVLKTGDLVFSLISGKCAIVAPSHDKYLFTQNYVRICPGAGFDARYLAYMINEDNEIRRQLIAGQQGSVTMKYSVKQLAELQFPDPPPIEKQEAIGDLYLSSLRVETLRKHKATLESVVLIESIKKAARS